MDATLQAAEARMREAGVGEVGIASFRRLHGLLRSGDRGVIPTAELEPVEAVPALEDLPRAAPADAAAALDRTVVLRLNGGLGTSMGLDGPKSLIEVKPGHTFLDVIARQVGGQREAHGARLPLLLMNTDTTRGPSLAALERHGPQSGDLPPDVVQHVEPRLRADDLQPVRWPADPALEWCPPGHGDLYAALYASGMLAALRERGYRHAFVANADNLGAVLDPRILTWVADERIPFLMEVVTGTTADRKGGHIARRDGRLVLRETAQTPEDDLASFGDVRRWRFYNTNNLWIDLDALDERLGRCDGLLELPLIVNRKSVVPGDPGSPEVLQLETAMGSALGVIDGARALHVPRRRFAPVKTTEDLLVVRSDVYDLGDDGTLAPVAPDADPPLIELDPAHYRRLADFEERFPAGAPSLRSCRRLTVRGDVRFGRAVRVEGEVGLEGPAEIPDGAVLGGRAVR